MNIKITENFKEVANSLKSKSEAATRAAERELQLSALEVESKAKQNAPVDTGMLRASISTTGGGSEYEVGTNIEYAPFIEYGTRYQAAQPFLSPAFQLVIRNLPQRIERAIKSVFN